MKDAPENRARSKTPEAGDAQKDNRRGPRVRLEVSVLVYSWGGNGQPFYDDAKTIEVSAYGGILATPRNVDVGQSILLIHPSSGEKMACQVRSVEPGESGMYRAAFVFETKSPTFWGIALPADDGKPQAPIVARARVEAPKSPKPAEHVEAPPAAKPAPRGTFENSSPRVERRTELRHKIIALVEVTEAESGKCVKARIPSLSRSGCYVKLDSPFAVGALLELSVTKDDQSFQAQARVAYSLPGRGMGLAFTVIAPEQLEILDKWIATNREAAWMASNRRRSHRIMLNVPVKIAGSNSLGAKFAEETSTESVSAHGALLLLATPLTRGQLVMLTNQRTRATLECSVVYLGQSQGHRREVGLSFTQPNRMFWQVAFPPWDWSSRHPDARGT
jgi:hypothetical protein